MQIISIPEQDEVKQVSIADGEHIVGEFIGDENGASLIVFGGFMAMSRAVFGRCKECRPNLKS